ncbi:carbamate kinase [Chloroflexota bacterium]
MHLKEPKTYVIALGGNSILRANEKTIEEQYFNLQRTCKQLSGLATKGNRIVITHGNGPQVGNLLLAFELAKEAVPAMPLDVCGAATEGFMGYMIQNTLANVLREAGEKHNITTVITQVVVDDDDLAFKNPTKPIGPFYDFNEAQEFQREKGWVMTEDSTRGYRRVVPSPRPVSIQQARIIKSMLDAGEIVIAIGGGGIPGIRGGNRSLRGVEAVIDKDYASSRLSIEIDADVFLILTAVECVFRDFGLPSQQALNHLTLAEAKKLLAEGQFGTGSMAPKIEAAIIFLEERDGEVIITLPETAVKALGGKTGTRITR